MQILNKFVLRNGRIASSVHTHDSMKLGTLSNSLTLSIVAMQACSALPLPCSKTVCWCRFIPALGVGEY